jgi:hypothetical protein
MTNERTLDTVVAELHRETDARFSMIRDHRDEISPR